MASPKDLQAKGWHAYGQRFSIIVPEEQPYPIFWDPELPDNDEKGRLSPQALKQWRYLFRTKEFLRHRYAKHHILEGPSLWFDCLVPKRHRRIRYRKAEDQDGQPVFLGVKDSHEWYDSSLRIGIFKWQVGFSCRSVLCQRKWCKLHRDNPHRINPADIYSLIDLFEGCGLGQAISIVSKWYGVKIQPFESKGTEQVQGYRYSVSKVAVYGLLSRYADMRHQHVESFVKEAVELIKGSPVVPWHRRKFDTDYAFFSLKVVGNLYRIKGPAAKAYLWLLIQQEENARNTKVRFSVTDAQLAKGMGVSKTTAAKYREHLQGLGLLKTEVERVGRGREVRVKSVNY